MKVYTKFQWFLETISVLFLLASFGYIFLKWSGIPETVPMHWGVNGVADSFGSKTGLLFVPVIAGILFAGISALQRHPSIWNFPVKLTDENRDRVYSISLTMLLSVKAVCSASFFEITHSMVNLKNMSLWVMMGELGLIFAIIAIGTYKCVKA